MTSKQEAKLNMYHAVIAHCDANSAIVATVPAFDTALNGFKTAVADIVSAAQSEAQVITGIASDKKVLKEALCQQASTVASVVYAYAIATNNNTLKEEVNFSLSELLRLKDDLLGPVATNIHDSANVNIAALAPYGILPATLTSLLNSVTDYTTAVPAPRNAVSLRTSFSITIKTRFKEADEIVKKQMDKIAIQFKENNTEFYNAYKSNREILDAPASDTGFKGLITDSTTSLPIAVTATLTLLTTSITTTSDATGNYKFSNVPIGTYNVNITAPGYASQIIPNVEVLLGQMKIVNINLLQEV